MGFINYSHHFEEDELKEKTMSDPCREAFERWLYNPSTNQDELDFGKSYSGNRLELAPVLAQAWFAAYTAIRTTLPTREELVELLCDFEADENADHGPTFQLADAILARIVGGGV